ncbi:hypothetical protein DKT77_03920 [Meridianimarinicoccus roseus]|uniref:Glutamine amidotransferase domain-containing protein n=1 Tax=Meridianimarinicoccus roseus TaxID=2072018 RepID=A0A2V2LE89_9RHOB|nr:hypothetical protein [Meridianimarinicoccus roseus]PWR03870.1 hypothetical protein DKT77_03920 [Meridianimarinicoccus roseus]
MTRDILYAPLIDPILLTILAALMVLATGFALWRGLSGWWLRALAAAVVLAALANPSLQSEERDALSDIVILVVDESASQRIAGRPDQTETAIAALETEVAQLSNTELRVVSLGDAPDNAGTLGMEALGRALADVPRARVAGMILLSDGQLHDIAAAPDLPAPLHLLLTGRSGDWDRRLLVKSAPAYAILGEPVTLTLRLEDQGDVPTAQGGTARLQYSVDGAEPREVEVPVGRDLQLPVDLPHGGINVIQFTVPVAEGELTDRNNSAVVRINGVRDRLRVLLVSGEPHAGERTWRNLLKSDSSVDLVHFTILRPPEKQDGVPVTELSLIAFPTRELFLEKIDEFDLIIFDRYKRRGILPGIYLDNIRQYVEGGGAVLVAAGPDFASAASLYRSPLAQVMPGEPTAQVIDRGYRPAITDLGRKHPVTAGLDTEYAAGAPDGEWGRWFRLIDVTATDTAEVVMSGPDERPLLLLDRIGDGRVALLASDQAWLWNRGFEGGGPQLELLRRLAHWMMKEPELEEEALTATSDGQSMTITRRTLGEGAGDFTVTAPDGTETVVTPLEVAPGRFEARLDGLEVGLYRIADGDRTTVAALGPSAPKEFEQTIASGDALEPVIAPTGGGIRRVEDGTPDLRQVREGRPAAGRGWIGVTPRGAYQTANVTVTPLLPGWAWLLLVGALIVGAWLWEGRRRVSSAA